MFVPVPVHMTEENETVAQPFARYDPASVFAAAGNRSTLRLQAPGLGHGLH